MSSGADCFFIESMPGEWHYKIQRYPYGAVEEYHTNGPFTSFTKAREHLDEHYQNPGGWSTYCLPEGQHIHSPVMGGWEDDDETGPLRWNESIRRCDACDARLPAKSSTTT